MNHAANILSLQKELECARAIKAHTDQILEIMNPGHHLSGKNLTVIAERIFEYLSNNKSTADFKELKALSNLILKHTAAYNKIKSLEIKIRQLILKETRFQFKPQDQKNSNNDYQNTATVSAPTIDSSSCSANEIDPSFSNAISADLPLSLIETSSSSPSMAALNGTTLNILPSKPASNVAQKITFQNASSVKNKIKYKKKKKK